MLTIQIISFFSNVIRLTSSVQGHYRNNNFAVVTNHANVKVFLPQRIPDHVKGELAHFDLSTVDCTSYSFDLKSVSDERLSTQALTFSSVVPPCCAVLSLPGGPVLKRRDGTCGPQRRRLLTA